jgi:hypothetical protein
VDSEFDGEEDEDEEEEDEEAPQAEEVPEDAVKLEQPDYQTMIANRNQKKKRKEAREADKDEQLYCFCQQVSYGDMVACDGEVLYMFIDIEISRKLSIIIFIALSL